MSGTCRLCRGDLGDQPLLFYPAMPKSAQHFPTADNLDSDRPVDLKIMQCPGCGLVQLDNEPVDYFREVIRASAFSKDMGLYRQQQFAEFVDEHALKAKKIIEIGCGRGEYLSLLKQQGVEAYGLEYAAASVEQCRRDALPVQQGYIEHAGYPLEHGPFDGFFIFNFLEHMPQPIEVLKGIAANLTEGAVGLVEVPNFDMMIRENQFTEFVTDHLCYYTRQTLTLLLELSGLEVLQCREIWGDYILSATVRKRRPLAVAGFLTAHQQLTKQLQDFVDDFGVGQVAIWGAGHQALAVMALVGLSDRIKYVVDSAPFKQHKLTPGTHYPIVAPAQFYDDALPAVMVMAAAYSFEVVASIRAAVKQPIRIAVLQANGLEIL